MLPSHSHPLIRAGLALAVIGMLILGIWLATTREARIPTDTVTELGAQEITQRALEIASNDYQGKPSDVRASRTTMGKLDVISCNPVGAWVSSFYDRLQGELDWCNPKTPVWVIDLSGEFRHGNTMTRSLSIVLDGMGKFVRLGSGALVQWSEVD